MTVSKKVVLRLNAKIVDQPIIYSLIKDYGLIPNILKAEINPQKEGYLVVEIQGEDLQYAAGLEFLNSLGVTIDALNEKVVRNEAKCIECGHCTGVCPTHALTLNRPEMTISFDGEKCVVCEICVKSCPVKAMELYF
ncbi:NIL domain-containing protein [Dehalobacterium formicoaceticum]|uniref:4Fe-4S binding protein n=1 Tax=Dehalobacterium formicoaceticum TaxID=51515 RepID=A0ABT1Y037_9FIRM|nr:NIL domain-containing protein [Dehalobacterium formicoaceticum]MCR6544237.1 4Fe-4S binding protein [Dehalobacterium formicoaceticum]